MFVELSVWGAKIHEKSAEMELALSASNSRGVKLNAKRWAEFTGVVRRTPISTLAQRHSSKELILWPPSGGPPHTAAVAMWGGHRHGGRWFLSALNHKKKPNPRWKWTHPENPRTHSLPISPGCQPVTPI